LSVDGITNGWDPDSDEKYHFRGLALWYEELEAGLLFRADH
jgi:hypothetical protein